MAHAVRLYRISNLACRIFERAAASNVLAVLMLLIVSALALSPGFSSLPPMDRDEPRFAQASKQILESGDFISIRFQNEARLKKPAGTYWLQAASVAAAEKLGASNARQTITYYRLPSFLAAVISILLTWWTAIPLAGRRAALLSGLIMAGCVLLGVEGRLAKTDAVQLMCLMAMMGVLARIFMTGNTENRQRVSVAFVTVFWVAMAGSILVKGPIGLLAVTLTILALGFITKQWRWLADLRPIHGIILTLLLVLPWFSAIMLITDGAFLKQSVGQDMLSKVAGGQESHGMFPGAYLLVFWGTFWPFAPLALFAAPWVWKNRSTPQMSFLLAWLCPFWLVFELFPTKLPHYVLPVYPAIAILIAACVANDGLVRTRWIQIFAVLIPLMPLVLTGVAAAAIWHYAHEIAWLAILLGIIAACSAAACWKMLCDGRGVEAILSALAGSLFLYWGIYTDAFPRLTVFSISPRLVQAAASSQCPHMKAASVGFREPSLVFLAGTDIKMPSAEEAANFLADGKCRAAFVEKGFEPVFLNRLAALNSSVRLTERVQGININGGKAVDIGVYQSP